MSRRISSGVLAAAALLGLAACGGSSGATRTDPAGPVGTVTVFAAASLKSTFTALAASFEKAHPGVHVRLSFGGSDSLAAGIRSGAPADVFAAASTKTMATVVDAGDTSSAPRPFVTNTLQIATPAGNPRHLTDLRSLTAKGVSLDLCGPTVPCGAAADKAFAAARVVPHPVSRESEVTAVLTKVELGEVDAGLVYRTDVTAAKGKVEGVAFPEAAKAVTTYPIATVKGGPNPLAAARFEDLVLGPEGQAVLRAAGFGTP